MAAYAAPSPPRPFIETTESAASFWQIGILWRLLASGAKTGGALCFLDEVVGAMPGGPVTHAHPQDEGFYMVEGHCSFHAGGETLTAGPGNFVAVPKYTEHAFLADAGARLLNFYLPPGFELLLMGLAAPAERNEAPGPDDFKLPPRRLVEKLSLDYGQIPVLGLPFADPPDPAKMATKPLAGANALPFMTCFEAAPAYWSAGALWTILAKGSTTGGSYCLFEQLCRGGKGAPPHLHLFEDEAFFILEGEVDFLVGDKREIVAAGGFVFVPKNIVHAFNVVSQTARMLNLYTRPGFERIIEVTGHKTQDRILPPADFSSDAVSKERTEALLGELGMLRVPIDNPFS